MAHHHGREIECFQIEVVEERVKDEPGREQHVAGDEKRERSERSSLSCVHLTTPSERDTLTRRAPGVWSCHKCGAEIRDV